MLKKDIKKKNIFSISLARITILMISILLISLPIELASSSSINENSTIYIMADGTINPLTAPIEKNGDVYSLISDFYGSIEIQRDNIVFNGNGHKIVGNDSGESTGLNLTERSGTTIKNLDISHFQYGIYLSSAEDNVITCNTISDCTYVIYAKGSRNNKIYLNNFLDQANSVYQGVNYWDDGYPNGGNFWNNQENEDNYSGVLQETVGSDGLGEIIYDIDEDNYDSYPLMGKLLIYNIPSLNEELYIISNSSINSINFNSQEHSISYTATGNAGTLGFCRILIPNTIFEESPTIYVNGETPQYINNLFENETHRWIYFSYENPKSVIIIPEFSDTILVLIFIASMFVVVISRKKLSNITRQDN